MLSVVWRNPSLWKTPRRVPEVVRSMRLYAKEHPFCRWCGKRSIEVHHILPIHAAPHLASERANMISLCRKCHLIVGHCGDYKRCVPNVVELCQTRKTRDAV